MMSFILSIAMLSAFLLLFGALRIWRRGGMAKPVWLMVVAALVILANVAIWTVPDNQGNSLVDNKR